jgi:predicted RNase H-like nuclease (RuvC/YqgF family)
MRFELRVDPKQTASLAVREAQPMQTTYQISNINDETVAMFVRQKSIDKSIEDALRKVLAAKAGVEAIDEQKEAREKDTQKIFDDQQRLRENMKALKGSPEEKSLLQRYTKQLNDQEDRLEKLRKEMEALGAADGRYSAAGERS